MEHSLLTPHDIVLKENGIPYRIIQNLIRGSGFHDANLKKGFGKDGDVQEINEMEQKLGGLSPEQIDRRVAVDCCCIWRYDYPERVHEICSIIGGSHHTALRLHYQVSPDRRQEFIDYAEALKGWIEDAGPDDKAFFREGARETTRKVYDFLGTKDPLKEMLAERTYLGLSTRALNCSFWGCNKKEKQTPLAPYSAQQLPGTWHQRMSALESGIQREMGHAAHDFLCDVGGSAEPACHFKFIRRVDILVSSIGCLKWRGNLPEKDGKVTGRRKLTERYLGVLEKYWNGGKTAYSQGDDSESLENGLFTLMGEPDDFKRWLAASLWKNIKNQTSYQAYPMKRWVEFVRIGEDYISDLSKK